MSPILAYLLLGEKMHWSFPFLFLFNIGGVVLITQPSFIFGSGVEVDPRGILICFVASILSCTIYPTTRNAQEAHVLQIEFTTGIGATCIFAPITIAIMWIYQGGISLENLHLPAVVGISLLQFTSVCTQTWSTKFTRALVAQMLMYIEVPYSLFMQWILFGDTLDGLQYVGVVLIVISAMCNAYFNIKRKQDNPENYKTLHSAQTSVQRSSFVSSPSFSSSDL